MYSDGAVCAVCTVMVLYVLLEAGSVAKFLVHGVTLLSVSYSGIQSNPVLCCLCVCVFAYAGAKVHFEQSLVRVIQSDGSLSKHHWPLTEKGRGLPAAVAALVEKAERVRRKIQV